jgi:acyl-CoA thioester hydrolase
MLEQFNWRLRVYYEDTDAGGIVFYANYLKFFERARTEWLRASGVNQQVLSETQGVMFVVKSTAMDYHAPAKLDDELNVTVNVRRLGRASVEFRQEAWRIDHAVEGGGVLLASGEIKVGCVNTSSLRPQAIPEETAKKIAMSQGIRP